MSEVMRSRVWTDGPWTAEVERRLCDLTGAPDAVAFNSCTSAIHAALIAVGCEAGTRVAVPAFSFAGTVTGARHINADLVFADVNPTSLNLDVVPSDVDVVLAVDLHGVPHELPRSRQDGRRVVTDACQSLGTTVAGTHIGGAGIHAWSFSSAKMVAAPDGGAVTCDDAAIADRLRELRDYGVPAGRSRSNAAVTHPGGHNWRPSELSMAMVANRLETLPHWVERSRSVAEPVHAAMRAAGLWCQQAPDGAEVAWHKLRFGPANWSSAKTERIAEALSRAGIPTHRWGSVPLHLHDAFRPRRARPMPTAEAAGPGTLCLGTESTPPITWTDSEVEHVCRVLQEVAERILQ